MNQKTVGWLNGLLGVLIFSGSLPATRLAVAELDPIFITGARASIASVLAAALLMAFKQVRPTRAELNSLLIVAFGVVVGFPLLTALALQYVTSAHSTVFIGLLPLMTAIFAVLRGGERPRPAFWIFSIIGSALVVGFALSQSITANFTGDGLMLLAIIVCGLGYAEGGKLARHLGGWQVISWALVISAPVMLLLMFFNLPASFSGISFGAWASLAYVSTFSMLIGFVFWYRGLALGGIATVGQLQLLQPFFALLLASLILGEDVSAAMLLTTAAVVLCVFAAKRLQQ
jgi:drug/metabolite transporter (DMT)-like permease